MRTTTEAKSAASPMSKAAAAVQGIDWARVGAELDEHGCATIGPLVAPQQCRSLSALYAEDARFRSRIVMARHGFGRGEYKYFAYPLPPLIEALRTALYPPLAAIANRWNEQMGIEVRYPVRHAEFLDRCHRPDQADAAAIAVCARRLQLPAPGPLRRACFSAAGGGPPVGAGRRLHRRRVRSDRAAPAHAVAGRGGAAAPGRGRGVSRAPPPGARHARGLSGQHAPRGEPAALRPAPYAGADLPRREVGCNAAKPALHRCALTLFTSVDCG